MQCRSPRRKQPHSRWIQAIILVILGVNFSGCKSESVITPPLTPISVAGGRQLSIVLDPQMSAEEQNLVRDDFNLLSTMQIDSTSARFTQVFGGPTSEHVLTFVDERINYLVPDSRDIDSRIRVNQSLPENEGIILASNLGTPLWLYRETIRPQNMSFQIGGEAIPLESSRIGIMMLGEGYTPAIKPMIRISTLVHEARHSDCTGGISGADIARIKAGLLPLQNSCGHLHVECPAGHPLAGLPACDNHAWGAYAVELVFAAVASQNCEACTERQRQELTAIASDSASRVTVLEPLLGGELGNPDMGSSGVR